MSAFGKTTLGLAYSLVFAEALLAPAIPSVAARAGGIFFPLVKALCLACGSDPVNIPAISDTLPDCICMQSPVAPHALTAPAWDTQFLHQGTPWPVRVFLMKWACLWDAGLCSAGMQLRRDEVSWHVQANGTEKKMGAYLMKTCFQTTCISSAMFITAMAANPLAVDLAKDALGTTISWGQWALAGVSTLSVAEC